MIFKLFRYLKDIKNQKKLGPWNTGKAAPQIQSCNYDFFALFPQNSIFFHKTDIG